jgi:hypothetical protein
MPVRVVQHVRRGVGDRQAARDDEVGRHETHQDQHQNLAAPAMHGLFEQADGALPIRRAANDIAVDRHGQQQRDQHEQAGGQRRQRPGRFDHDRRQIGQGAEVVQADQSEHQPPRAGPRRAVGTKSGCHASDSFPPDGDSPLQAGD